VACISPPLHGGSLLQHTRSQHTHFAAFFALMRTVPGRPKEMCWPLLGANPLRWHTHEGPADLGRYPYVVRVSVWQVRLHAPPVGGRRTVEVVFHRAAADDLLTGSCALFPQVQNSV